MNQTSTDRIDIIAAEEARTIPGLLFKRANHDPDAIGLTEFRQGQWVHLTWHDIALRIGQFRVALDRAGMEPGDRVAILLPNGSDWVAFDIAAMANGLITVPLYIHDSPASICAMLDNAGARLCILDSRETWDALAPLAQGNASLKHIWIRQDRGLEPVKGPRNVSGLSQVLTDDRFESGDIRCRPDDIATIIYTSGTTGSPKGVKLSHHALLWNTEANTKQVTPLKSDVFLSVLPAAHAFERTLGYHLPIMCGSRIVYARSLDKLQEDVLEIRPTVLVAVPRLYERWYEGITEKVAADPVKGWLTQTAADIGWQFFEARQGRGPLPGFFKRHLLWPLLERLVARPVTAAFGGRLRVAISGGAPVSTEVSSFMIGLGIPLMQGYGLTEAAPVVTAVAFDDNDPSSAGRPLKGVDLRISDDGELLVKSPSMMAGYWNDPERSKQAFDAEGWLKTGDVAEIRQGWLYIKGRMKDTIILSTAKKVSPTEIETAIAGDPLFDQACVFGTDRPCLIAAVVLNNAAWCELAEANGLDASAPNQPSAAELIRQTLAKATEAFPPYAQVRGVHADLHPWTIADGAITPTLKVRRHVIAARYTSEIDALYKQLASDRPQGTARFDGSTR